MEWDIGLIHKNAFLFNEPDSAVVKESSYAERVLLAVIKRSLRAPRRTRFSIKQGNAATNSSESEEQNGKVGDSVQLRVSQRTYGKDAILQEEKRILRIEDDEGTSVRVSPRRRPVIYSDDHDLEGEGENDVPSKRRSLGARIRKSLRLRN